MYHSKFTSNEYLSNIEFIIKSVSEKKKKKKKKKKKTPIQ